MWNFVAPILGAGISGLFSQSNAREARAAQDRAIEVQKSENEANRQAIAAANERSEAWAQRNLEVTRHYADLDRQMQDQYAREGVRMRTKDALEAGVHPLYALGGNFASYTPSAVTVGSPSIQPEFGGHTSAPTHFADTMGQDIGRAVASTATAFERDAAFDSTTKALTVQKMGLENELLASQIARLRGGQVGPAAPSSARSKAVSVALGGDYNLGGLPLTKAPGVSDMSDVTDRIGDEGPIPAIAGMVTTWRDLQHTYGKKSIFEILEAVDRATQIDGSHVPQISFR